METQNPRPKLKYETLEGARLLPEVDPSKVEMWAGNRYRIKESWNGLYYPQVRWLFFWITLDRWAPVGDLGIRVILPKREGGYGGYR